MLWKKLLFSLETLISLIVAVIVFWIFSGETTILGRFFYALIVGVSTWLLIFVFKYTLIWFWRAINKR